MSGISIFDQADFESFEDWLDAYEDFIEECKFIEDQKTEQMAKEYEEYNKIDEYFENLEEEW